MSGGPLAQLAIHFTLLSFVAVGGVTAVIPEVHRQRSST
jgi:chromate transport protein ChrA